MYCTYYIWRQRKELWNYSVLIICFPLPSPQGGSKTNEVCLIVAYISAQRECVDAARSTRNQNHYYINLFVTYLITISLQLKKLNFMKEKSCKIKGDSICHLKIINQLWNLHNLPLSYLIVSHLSKIEKLNKLNLRVKTDTFSLQILKCFPNQWAGTTTYSTCLLQVLNPVSSSSEKQNTITLMKKSNAFCFK